MINLQHTVSILVNPISRQNQKFILFPFVLHYDLILFIVIKGPKATELVDLRVSLPIYQGPCITVIVMRQLLASNHTEPSQTYTNLNANVSSHFSSWSCLGLSF